MCLAPKCNVLAETACCIHDSALNTMFKHLWGVQSFALEGACISCCMHQRCTCLGGRYTSCVLALRRAWHTFIRRTFFTGTSNPVRPSPELIHHPLLYHSNCFSGSRTHRVEHSQSKTCPSHWLPGCSETFADMSGVVAVLKALDLLTAAAISSSRSAVRGRQVRCSHAGNLAFVYALPCNIAW